MAKNKRGTQDRERALQRERAKPEAQQDESPPTDASKAPRAQERAASDLVEPALAQAADRSPTFDRGKGELTDDTPVNPLGGEATNLDVFTSKGLPGVQGDVDLGGHAGLSIGSEGQLDVGDDSDGGVLGMASGQSMLDSAMGGAASLRGGLGVHNLGDGPTGDSNAMSGGFGRTGAGYTDHAMDTDRNVGASETFGHRVTNTEVRDWSTRQTTGQDKGAYPGTNEAYAEAKADPTQTKSEAESKQASDSVGEDPLETVPAATPDKAGPTDATPAPVGDDTVAGGEDPSGTGTQETVVTTHSDRVDAILGVATAAAPSDIGGDLARGQGAGDPGDGVDDGTGGRGGIPSTDGTMGSSTTDGAIDFGESDGTTDIIGAPAIDYVGPSGVDPLDEIGGAGLESGLPDVPSGDGGGSTDDDGDGLD